MKKLALLFLFISVFYGPVSAQNIDFELKYKIFGAEEGMRTLQVASQAFLFDKTGFLWIGGNESQLTKFDGYSFIQYPFKNIPVGFEDSEGQIWLIQSSRFLLRYDASADRFLSVKAPSRIYNLIDYQDFIICFSAEGLLRFDKKKNEFLPLSDKWSKFEGMIDNNMSCVLRDGENHVWVGSRVSGLYRMDLQDGTYEHFVHKPEDPESLIGNAVWSLAFDSKKNVLVGTHHGLSVWDRGTGKFSSLAHVPGDENSLSDNLITGVFTDSEGISWIGTESGLNLYTPDRKIFRKYTHDSSDLSSIPVNKINAVKEDKQGNIWLTSSGTGLIYAQKTKNTIRTYPYDSGTPGRLNATVTSLGEAKDGKIYAGTWGGGVNIFDPETEVFEALRHGKADSASLANDIVWRLNVDKDGRLWTGDYFTGTLHGILPGGKKFERFGKGYSNSQNFDPGRISALANGTDRQIWVGTSSQGIYKFDLQSGDFQNFAHDPEDKTSLSYRGVSTMYTDRGGNVWAGTLGKGLNLFRPETQDFQRFQHRENDATSLSNDTIRAMHEDAAGNFWVISYSGLDKMDRDSGTFSNYLSGIVLVKILEDNLGNLWLVSDLDGICRFNPKNGNEAWFTLSDGLLDSRILGTLAASDGNLYFGGEAGLTVFRPDSMQINTQIPETVFSRLYIFNQKCRTVPDSLQSESRPNFVGSYLAGKEDIYTLNGNINLLEELVIPDKYNNFTLEFSALNFGSVKFCVLNYIPK